MRFSGEIDPDKANEYFQELELTENRISGVLKKKPEEFLVWINAIVTVESFKLKVPTLEQIFIEEVRMAS